MEKGRQDILDIRLDRSEVENRRIKEILADILAEKGIHIEFFNAVQYLYDPFQSDDKKVHYIVSGIPSPAKEASYYQQVLDKIKQMRGALESSNETESKAKWREVLEMVESLEKNVSTFHGSYSDQDEKSLQSIESELYMLSSLYDSICKDIYQTSQKEDQLLNQDTLYSEEELDEIRIQSLSEKLTFSNKLAAIRKRMDILQAKSSFFAKRFDRSLDDITLLFEADPYLMGGDAQEIFLSSEEIERIQEVISLEPTQIVGRPNEEEYIPQKGPEDMMDVSLEDQKKGKR